MSVISGSKLTTEMQRLKDTGKIDSSIGAENVGKLLDTWNQGVEKSREKRFNKDVHDRNLYFRKLFKKAAEDVRSGRKTAKKLSLRKVFY